MSSTHIDLWVKDVFAYLKACDDMVTVTDIMIATNLGRPAVEAALGLITENIAHWYPILALTTNDAGVIKVTRVKRPTVTRATAIPRTTACRQHRAVTVDDVTHTVVCRDCGYMVDPYEFLRAAASEWDAVIAESQALLDRRAQLRDEVAALIREERNARTRLKRIKESMRFGGAPARTTTPKHGAPPPDDLKERLERMKNAAASGANPLTGEVA